MPGFTSVFGGSNIAPALPTYLPLSIAVNTLLGWPTELTAAGQPVLAEILDVTATVGGLSLQLSDARQSSTGYCALFNNVATNSFAVIDNLGNTLMTVASGQVWQIYLADNSTQGGTWRVFQFGAGVSNANAASLAGAGLKAISTTLNENITINQQSANYAIQNADRAACVEWTGGSGGVLTSPSPAAVGSGWFCFVQNSGTGTFTFTPASGTINGAASQIFQPLDSAIIVTDGTNFFTIGLGRSIASTFNFVQISLAGATGTVVLAGAQLNRISYRFTGLLAGNTTVQVPGSIQQYWVDNETTGAFTLTFSSAGGGSTTAVAQGNKAILYCDGTNVVNAVTIPSVAAGGTNTQVQYNNAGAFGGSTMTFQVGTGAFSIPASSSGDTLTVFGSQTLRTTAGGGPVFNLNSSLGAYNSTFNLNAAGGGAGFLNATGGSLVLQQGGVSALSIAAGGAVSIVAPSSGTALTVNGLSASNVQSWGSTGAGNLLSIAWVGAWNLYTNGTDPLVLAATGAASVTITTNNLARLVVGSAGNVTINAPGSTTNALTVNGISTANVINMVSTGAAQPFGVGWAVGITNNAWNLWSAGTDSLTVGTQGVATLTLATNNANRLQINSLGNVVIGAPTSGNTLSLTGIAGAITFNVSNTTAGAGYACRLDGGTTKVPLLLGYSVSLPAIDFGGYSTGGATATFAATNKPGANATVIAWVGVSNGSGAISGYIPIFGP